MLSSSALLGMSTHRQTRHPRPPRGVFRYSHSSPSLAHTPTLEPMLDEETEDEEGDIESPFASTTPSSPSPDSGVHGREPSSVSVMDDAPPPFQTAPSLRTGGVGLFATRPISRGTLIFSEPPLLTQPPMPTRTNSTVMAALAQHSREEQRQFFALWNAFKTGRPAGRNLLPALGIFETNALPCGLPATATGVDGVDKAGKGSRSTDGGREGIFLRAARLNHSCRPNVSRMWDAATEEMAFRALRDIQAGEELCMCYIGIDLLGSRLERLAELREAFGFVCSCEACVLEGSEGEESDRKRDAVRRLFEEIGKCGKEPTLGIRKVKIALRHLNDEQLVHYEALFCFDAFQFCILVSDFTNAKAWVRKAWEASCSMSGPDSVVTRTFKMYWANPRAHQLAGMLPPMTLSGPETIHGRSVSNPSVGSP